MKKKFIVLLLIILVLTQPASPKLLKRKKKAIFTTTAVILLASAVVHEIKEYKSDLDKQAAIKMYAKHIEEIEDILNRFQSSIMTLCSRASVAAAIYSQTKFSLKVKIPKMVDESQTQREILSSLQGQRAIANLSNNLIKFTRSIGIQEVDTALSVNSLIHGAFLGDQHGFNNLERSLDQFVRGAYAIRDTVCFQEHFSFADKFKNEAVKAMHQLGEELEGTISIVSLLSTDIYDVRETVEHYLNIYDGSLERYLNTQSYCITRFFKGALKLVITFVGLGKERSHLLNYLHAYMNSSNGRGGTNNMITLGEYYFALYKVLKAKHDEYKLKKSSYQDSELSAGFSILTGLYSIFKKSEITREAEETVKTIGRVNDMAQRIYNVNEFKTVNLAINALKMYKNIGRISDYTENDFNTALQMFGTKICNGNEGVCKKMFNFSDFPCPKDILLLDKHEIVKNTSLIAVTDIGDQTLYLNYDFGLENKEVISIMNGTKEAALEQIKKEAIQNGLDNYLNTLHLSAKEFKFNNYASQQRKTVVWVEGMPSPFIGNSVQSSNLRNVFCKKIKVSRIGSLHVFHKQSSNVPAHRSLMPHISNSYLNLENILRQNICSFIKNMASPLSDVEISKMKSRAEQTLRQIQVDPEVRKFYTRINNLTDLIEIENSAFSLLDMILIGMKEIPVNMNFFIYEGYAMVSFCLKSVEGKVGVGRIFTSYNTGSPRCLEQNLTSKDIVFYDGDQDVIGQKFKMFMYNNEMNFQNIENSGSLLTFQMIDRSNYGALRFRRVRSGISKHFTYAALNRELYKFNRETGHLYNPSSSMMDMCSYSVQFKKIRIGDDLNKNYNIYLTGEKDKYGFPIIEVDDSNPQNNLYKSTLFIMLSYKSKRAKQTETRRKELNGMYKKLSHFGWFPLPGSRNMEDIPIFSGEETFFKIVASIAGFNFEGNLRIDVFVQPAFKSEPISVCKE